MYWVAVRRALNGCMNTGCSLMLRDIVDCANVGIPHPPVNDTDVANGNVGGGTIPIVPFKAKAAQGARTHSAYPLFPGCQELGAACGGPSAQPAQLPENLDLLLLLPLPGLCPARGHTQLFDLLSPGEGTPALTG